MTLRFHGAGRTAQATGRQRPRPMDEPAHTITGSRTAAFSDGVDSRQATLEELSALQSYPTTLRKEELLIDLIALDLFAGTGWGVACNWLGIQEWGVDNMDEVVETRKANGMETIFRDVWTGLLAGIPGVIEYPGLSLGAQTILDNYNLLIASPPCQTFSQAGAGEGRKALDQVIAAVKEGRYKDPADLHKLGKETDPRTALVLTPLAYAYRDKPLYVVLEQVPPVLPVWEACAVELRELGYSVATGIVHAEQYGVPQTRKRAILIARLDDKEAHLPTPTHSKYYNRDPKKLDPGVKKWVSMAEALGWGTTAKPSFTVTGGGRQTGGYEAFPTGARAGMSKAIEDGTFEPREVALSSNIHFGRGTVRDSDEPAPTITAGKDYNDRGWLLRSNYGTSGNPENRGERDQDEPAATITSKAARNFWVERSSQSVAGEGRAERPVDEPAFTITQNSDRVRFVKGEALVKDEQGNILGQVEDLEWTDQGLVATVKLDDTIAGSPREADDQWKWKDTPATTIAGDPRITAREHHYHGEQNSTSFRLEQHEAETLQSYPPMQWKGTKGKVFLQIGNAVPPVLAAAILSTLLDD